jgi:Mrp family chromosome partitioning ATPase
MTIRAMRQNGGETNGAGKPGRETGQAQPDPEAPVVLHRTESPAEAPAPVDPWKRLRQVALDPRHLARHRLISAGREDPAYVAFDVLRTRLLQALKARGWSRVAITSPTKGCGKTFVSANLAFSLARTSSRIALMDMDLRIPSLATVLGVREPDSMLDFLTGRRSMERHLLRVAPNLAVGLNAAPVADASELLQAPETADTLAAMQDALRPDVVIYDLPPALLCDDLIAFLPQVDGVLLVAGGGVTQAEDVRKCERLLADQTPLLGVILNKAEDATLEPYGYIKK